MVIAKGRIAEIVGYIILFQILDNTATIVPRNKVVSGNRIYKT